MAGFPNRTQRVVLVRGTRDGAEDWRVAIVGSPTSPPSPRELAIAMARGTWRQLSGQGFPIERGIFDEHGNDITQEIWTT